MKRKILILLASLLIATAMSSLVSVFADEEKVTYDAEAIKQEYLTTSYATEKEKLETMEELMKVGNYALYIEKTTGEMALKKGNQILWSNPFDIPGTKIADTQKYELFSQILLNYTTISTGASATMNSFEEAAMRINSESGNNQIVVKKISGGVRVEYTMGRTETRVLVPRQISKERFETMIIEPLQEAARQNLTTTDGESAKFLLSKFVNNDGKSVFYSLKDPNAKGVTERQKRAMYLQYPITEKMPVYVIDSNATQVELVNWLEKAIVNFTDYTFEDMANDHSMTNYTGTDVAPPLFRIAIEYYLTEDGLTYRVPANGIRFDSTLYRLDDVTILPYLGAGTASSGGYTFIPDGSGSIVNFEDVEKQSIQLSGKIYGQDYAYYNLTGANQEIMRLPVFGTVVSKVEYTTLTERVEVKDENGNVVLDANGKPLTEVVTKEVKNVKDSAVLSIITEGEAIGTITSKHGGTVNPYNTTYTTYVPRPNDSYALNQFSESSTSMWTVVTDRRYTGNISVKVIMLTGNQANYSGMANAYREYLTSNGELTKLDKAEEKIPLFIESFGAIEVSERILGVPVNVKKPLTTYDDLEKMVTELQEKGIGRVNVKYTSWANDAFKQQPFSKLNLEKATGGKSGLSDFLAFAKENNAYIYPDVELSYVFNLSMFDGFDYNKMVSRRVDKRIAFKLEYDDEYQGFTIWNGDVVSPQFMSEIWNKIEKKYQKLGIGGISVGSLGRDLNSDHNKKRPLNRVEAQNYVDMVLSEIKEGAGEMLVDGGNAYALKYANLIVDAPLESSRYIFASREVPFYSMVVHGSLQFAGSPINAAPDYDAAVLKIIESGAMPFFRVSYQNTNELKSDIMTSKYFSVDYTTWFNDMVETYTEINEVLADLQNVYIVNHDALTKKTVCVTYENGTEIFVNYDRSTVYIFKDDEGNYAVSYKLDETGKKVLGEIADKDQNGKETLIEKEFDIFVEIPGYSYKKIEKGGDN